jgi:hypothetical protein
LSRISVTRPVWVTDPLVGIGSWASISCSPWRIIAGLMSKPDAKPMLIITGNCGMVA